MSANTSLVDALATIANAATSIDTACTQALRALDESNLNRADHERELWAIRESAEFVREVIDKARWIAAGDEPATAAIDRAMTLIRRHLPRDGWHPAAPILQAVTDAGISERTAQRAARRLGLSHRRAKIAHAPSEWRWSCATTRSLATVTSRRSTATNSHGYLNTHGQAA
jgi:hypothetical protein